MRLPAIYSKIGDWSYYTSSMTFNQVNDFISRVDQELHNSHKLNELLQRALTNNFMKISDYILSHEDRFFNSLVLAVYDGDPQYREIDFEYENEKFETMGLLEFTGSEKIFPVDGQHRVEGIKEALLKNPDIGEDKIPVIIIGHHNTSSGKERTRRLFSTLNRYAKPVKKSEIIALDEDDISAIVTRDLVENHRLFNEDQISLSNTLQENNTHSFTTIETLYDCNNFLLKNYLTSINFKGTIDKYLRIRPEEEEILAFREVCQNFWDLFIEKCPDVSDFVSSETGSTNEFRFREGGNLLFRPAGLSPFVQAVTLIKARNNKSYEDILENIKNINFTLTEKPWNDVLWREQLNRVILNNKAVVKLLFVYLYQLNNTETVLSDLEVDKVKEKYANITNEDKENIEGILISL